MAEIQQSGGGKKQKGRTTKVSTKVDMTPMVDLAFLLITFFMLTTSMGRLNAMEVNMPDKTQEEKVQDVKESHAVTLLVEKNGTVRWYQGLNLQSSERVSFEELSKVLKKKNKEISKLVVLIKFPGETDFRYVVKTLDQMHVNDIKRFAIVKISDEETAHLKTVI
jgi:biopolymer transport protein ExbD